MKYTTGIIFCLRFTKYMGKTKALEDFPLIKNVIYSLSRENSLLVF